MRNVTGFTRTVSLCAAGLLCGAVLTAAEPSPKAKNAAADQKAADQKMTPLLSPGQGLDEHWTTTGNWSVDEQGVATLTPRPGEKGWQRYGAYLWSNEQYDDFRIAFDYKVQEKGNSGFYFNVADKDDPVNQGIEVQIFDAAKNKEKLTDHDSGGIIPGLPPTAAAGKPAGEWNRVEVTVRGETVTVQVNGQTVNEVNLNEQPRLKDRPDSGYIGFQDHGLPLQLRNISIRRL